MKICLSLAESSLPALEAKIAKYSCSVPYVEVRLDHLAVPSLPALPGGTCQWIATCRPIRQGGLFSGTEDDRLGLLQQAARSGFDWIDLEHDVARPASLSERVRVIRSRHDFGAFPRNLEKCYYGMEVGQGECRKLAVQVSTTSELVQLLRFMESLPAEPARILLGMGLPGQPSRYLGAILGNAWTYVAETPSNLAAPGQFSLKESSPCMAAPRLSASPEVYAVLGNPVAHSLSPQLHNGLFAHFGLDKIYYPFQLDNAAAWMDYVRSSRVRFAGFSVTIPFKSDFAELVDRKDTPVPALNTLTREGDLWTGYNTDLEGFLNPLRRRMSLRGKTALVLGNGGVAHTVVSALQGEGVDVTIVGRNPQKVARFIQHHGCSSIPRASLPFKTDLLINTTPVGQFPNTGESPLQAQELQCDLAYDLVYHPERTLLLRMAEKKAIETISGIEMFVEQAACQFHLWTGIRPHPELIGDLIGRALARERTRPEQES